MKKFLLRINRCLLLLVLFVGYEPYLDAQALLMINDFGIKNAKTGVERYRLLLNAHKSAIEEGKGVSYEGIDKIDLEIPQDPQSIPLPSITDFAGVTITVVNRQKSFHLFTMQGKKVPVNVNKKQLRRGNYKSIEALEEGTKVLILEDRNPWIRQRKGYDEEVIRKDILYLKNGNAKNKPVQSYITASTSVKAYWFEGGLNAKVFKNLVFWRSADSSKETFLIRLDCQDNVELSDITVRTPQSNMYADQIISITNCSNIMCKNIKIDGTYSQKDKYGYGISMNNVWNSTFDRIDAKGEWGVFGCYNVNYSKIINSSLNRFDIHCYGRDVYMERCVFNDLYNQFSSVYGEIYFTQCIFRNFTPLLIEPSFNANTPFDVTMKECVFYLDRSHNCIVHLGGLSDVVNEREELKEKYLPNITIKDCKVIALGSLKEWYVLQTGKIDGVKLVKNKANVRVKKVTMEGNNMLMTVVSDSSVVKTCQVKIKTN